MNRLERHLLETADIRGAVSPELFEYSVNVSLQNNYMFVEVPKAGCSTVKATLQKFEWSSPEHQWENFDDVHEKHMSPLMCPRRVLNFAARLNAGDWYRFAFVREPFGRLLSVYLDKICKPTRQKARLATVLPRVQKDINANVSFEEFVHLVCAQDFTQMDNHWRPQHELLCFDRIRYDKIGRLESFETDFAEIMQAIGVGSKYYDAFAPHKTDSSQRIGDYYTSELKELVAAKYQGDFERLGYSADTGI